MKSFCVDRMETICIMFLYRLCVDKNFVGLSHMDLNRKKY